MLLKTTLLHSGTFSQRLLKVAKLLEFLHRSLDFRTFASTMERRELNIFLDASMIVKMPADEKPLCFTFFPWKSPPLSPSEHLRSPEESNTTLCCSGSSHRASYELFNGKNGPFEFLSTFDLLQSASSNLRSDKKLEKALISDIAEDDYRRFYVYKDDSFLCNGFLVACEEIDGRKLSALHEVSKMRLQITKIVDDSDVLRYAVSSYASPKENYELKPSDKYPKFHPLYLSANTSEYHSIYHKYEDAIRILNQNLDIPEVVQLLDIVKNEIEEPLSVEKLQSKLRYPFIVIEGIDATGKSTLASTLSKLLGARQMHTPSDKIRDLRKTFDDLPEMIRRAYYSLGNYIVAKDVAEQCQDTPLIMDRFWHSTTAYALANDCDYDGISNLPPIGHEVYKWPQDLLKPNIILLLSVSEEIRMDRLRGRHEPETWEEKKLSTVSGLFRKKLFEAYRRFESPPCEEIDADVTKEQVAERARNVLRRCGLLE